MHVRPRMQRSTRHGMGWVQAAAAIGSAYMQNQEQKEQQESGGGGAAGMPGTTIAPTTTVSPTIQQSFTPQVSPVFQQSSGGGSQTATTTQLAPGGQSGQGGSSVPNISPGGGTSSQPGYGYMPSYGAGSNLPSLAPDPFYKDIDYSRFSPTVQTNEPMIPRELWMLGGIAIIGLAVFAFMPQRKKSA